jgi:hypothetical protein
MLAAASNGVSSTLSSTGAGGASDGFLGGGEFFLVILSLIAEMLAGGSTDSLPV